MPHEFDPRQKASSPKVSGSRSLEEERERIISFYASLESGSQREKAAHHFVVAQAAVAEHLTTGRISDGKLKYVGEMRQALSNDEYREAYREMQNLKKDWFPGLTPGISDPVEQQYKFAQELLKIEDEAEERKSSSPQSSPQK